MTSLHTLKDCQELAFSYSKSLTAQILVYGQFESLTAQIKGLQEDPNASSATLIASAHIERLLR